MSYIPSLRIPGNPALLTLGDMEYDLDRFCRDLEQRLKWLLNEVKRLKTENTRLLEENKELREEVTLVRLHNDIDTDADFPPELAEGDQLPMAMPPEAVEFYHKLPDRLNFADFFQYAESEMIVGDRAREFMLLFFRENMLEQRGRRIEKSRSVRRPSPTLQ